MIVKPYISFLNEDSDAQLIVDITGIITGMTGNASYLTPAPSLLEIQTALDEFSTAVSAAADGGITLTSIKNDKRAALVALVRELASYVQVTCKGNMTVLLSSNFPVQKPQRTPIGQLPAPTDLVVVIGVHSGELVGSISPIPGASIYNWRIMLDSAPTVVVQSAQSTAANNTFAGLTPGETYITQVNAVGSAGPSDWSVPVPQMVV